MEHSNEIISHIQAEKDGKWIIQSNENHQNGVAKRAEEFASAFGMRGWGYALGMLHDKGKESHDFQQYIRKNSGYDPNIKSVGEHNHAYVGGIIARNLYGTGVDNLLTNQIISHHTGLHDTNEINTSVEQDIPTDVDTIVPKFKLEPPRGICKEPKDFHHLSRMLFSCLVDADWLDTEAFMNEESAKLRGNHASLESLYPILKKHLEQLQLNATVTDVNSIRKKVQQCCSDKAESAQGFYSLTVPTGGGKTLSSLLWAMKHAIKHHLNRIIIAIPYTSIIVQTAGTLKKIFGEEDVLEHHSNVNPEDIKDERLREQIKLATENWDYPIIVTTNVQLFESMFSNRPSDCRKLHNIVRSVIILDEVQTLPIDFLQPIVDSLVTYNRLFNVSVLFTTASQPILSGLIEGCNSKASFQGIRNITEIIPAKLELHNKLRRVLLNIDDAGKTYDEVAAMLKRHNRVLCIVNTRRDAKELYERLPEEGIKIHLSKMMCPSHIKSEIERMKQALTDDRNAVIRVISTQLVEAGVDIDFPVVFRQEAGLDSVLQAAGRCNREGKQESGTTFVFSLSKEKSLPSGHMSDANNARLALGMDMDWFAPDTMKKYFEQLYCRQETFDKMDMNLYLYKPMELCFKEAANKFHLIEDNGISVIVNRGNSMEIVEELKREGMSYKRIKQLSQYSVNIYKRDFDELRKNGAIEEVIDGIYVIMDTKQYNENIGLRTDNHWQEEILMA